jgi:hypothetical protein
MGKQNETKVNPSLLLWQLTKTKIISASAFGGKL